jgi:hypothetical protein
MCLLRWPKRPFSMNPQNLELNCFEGTRPSPRPGFSFGRLTFSPSHALHSLTPPAEEPVFCGARCLLSRSAIHDSRVSISSSLRCARKISTRGLRSEGLNVRALSSVRRANKRSLGISGKRCIAT